MDNKSTVLNVISVLLFINADKLRAEDLGVIEQGQ
jgi:hypothetical protein